MKFVISIPIWGAWHTHLAQLTVIPTVFAALDYANATNNARFVIHTPNPDSFRKIFEGRQVEYVPLAPHPIEYLRFATSHKEVLYSAEDNEVVCLLCADLIVCQELFSMTQLLFSRGKRAVAILGPRTLFDLQVPAADVEAPILSSWAMQYAHPVTLENFYGTGHSRWPSTVYFKDEHGISCHAWHLHPIMVMKDRYLTFGKNTIDDDLLNCFTEDEIHVVTNNEMSICEVSPPHKQVGIGNPLNEDEIAQWAAGHASPRHRWLFGHRIVLTGNGANSQATANRILQKTAGLVGV